MSVAGLAIVMTGADLAESLFDGDRGKGRPRASGGATAPVADSVADPALNSAAGSAAPAVDDTDAVDIRRAVGGDGDAFSRLVQRYQTTIGAQLWRFTRDPAALEELLHDVFVEAFTSLPRFRGDAPLVHWLRKIAMRVGYRHWKLKSRSKLRVHMVLEECEAPVAELSSEPSEAALLVHRTLELLPPRDRLVLTVLYLDGSSVAEAAALIGWSQTMVKVQAHRARKKLKKLLENQSSD